MKIASRYKQGWKDEGSRQLARDGEASGGMHRQDSLTEVFRREGAAQNQRKISVQQNEYFCNDSKLSDFNKRDKLRKHVSRI